MVDGVLAETTGTGDALGLIDIRRDELRGLSTLFQPDPVVAALSGWPELPGAYAVQLDMHRARLQWASSQLCDPEPARKDARAVASIIQQNLEPAERTAFDLSVDDLA